MNKQEKETLLEEICFVKEKILEMIGEHCQEMHRGMRHDDDDLDLGDLKYLHWMADLVDDIADAHELLHKHQTELKDFHYKKEKPNPYTK